MQGSEHRGLPGARGDLRIRTRPRHGARRRALRRRRLLRTVSVALLLGIAGYVIASNVGGAPARSISASRGAKNRNKKPSTTAAKDITPPVTDVFTVPAVAAYLAGSNDGLTAAVFDVDNGYTSVYRPGVAEDTASIVKVDILATLLAQTQAQGSTLSDDEQDTAQGMIEESDNDDATDLWNIDGGAPGVARFNARVGLTQTTPNVAWGLTTTTPTDQLTLLKTIVFPNSLLTDASRNYELSLMTNVDPSEAWGISGGVPAGVTIAIKNGWLPLDAGGWEINSIGYVNGDGRDYLIAVLSNGNATEAQGITTIQGLASLVWQEFAPAA
jgi:Beta-lactamase enzyme family